MTSHRRESPSAKEMRRDVTVYVSVPSADRNSLLSLMANMAFPLTYAPQIDALAV
jgi:hypothetical protein